MRSRFQFYRLAIWLVAVVFTFFFSFIALNDARNGTLCTMSVCLCVCDFEIYDNMHLVKLLLLLLFSYLFLYDDDDYVGLALLFFFILRRLLMTCTRTCNLSRLLYISYGLSRPNLFTLHLSALKLIVRFFSFVFIATNSKCIE